MTREAAEETLDPRIRISAPLRCDGIGRLDCAEDLESGGRLAVRWLPLDANGDAAVRACGLLPSHPTLPRIRQIGHVGGSAFVAMDFPEGQLLSTMVGGGERLDVDLVIRVAAQLSDALAVVHAQQVVHGELSPDSVLLVPADRAYLWDMPLVIANRLSDRRGENRLMQNLVKTAPYLAPERARGDGASCEADVYSLGVLLCVAAGAPLPVATTTLGVVHQVANVSWAPRVPSLLPDPWRAMLTRMVSVDAALRPTAAQVAQVFAERPMPVALPTVPEFPAVQLPPALLAIADAAMKKGLSAEQDIPPAEPPRPALTLEAPVVDVVRIPSTEIEAIEAEPDPEPVPPAPPAIQLTESVAVSSELHQAGAHAVGAVPVEPMRQSVGRLGALVGAFVGIMVAAAFVAFSLAARQVEARTPAVAPAVELPRAPTQAQPQPLAHAEDEELSPLPTLAPREPAPAATPKVPRPAVRSAPVRRSEPVSAPVAAGSSAENDFSFLENVDPPQSELKRPVE